MNLKSQILIGIDRDKMKKKNSKNYNIFINVCVYVNLQKLDSLTCSTDFMLLKYGQESFFPNLKVIYSALITQNC